MGKAVIGRFFKNKKSAEKNLKNQNKMFKNAFVILEFPNGYLVCSKRQIMVK